MLGTYQTMRVTLIATDTSITVLARPVSLE